LDVTGTVFGSIVRNPVQLIDVERGVDAPVTRFENAPGPTRTWGGELLARYRIGDLALMVTHAYTQSTEFDIERQARLDVPLNPRHSSSLNVMWEGDDWGRAGVELYYIGTQRLEDNPFRLRSRPHTLLGLLYERRLGVARVFANAENLANFRQTSFEPLVLPARARDGRWTVDAWAPLDGVVVNGGMRFVF
jgi:outer membrane receptor for ferrienterochelin and colicins